jgi:hypothetical protein
MQHVRNSELKIAAQETQKMPGVESKKFAICAGRHWQ